LPRASSGAERTATVAGLEFTYRDSASSAPDAAGVPVICLHETGATAASWDGLTRAIAAASSPPPPGRPPPERQRCG